MHVVTVTYDVLHPVGACTRPTILLLTLLGTQRLKYWQRAQIKVTCLLVFDSTSSESVMYSDFHSAHVKFASRPANFAVLLCTAVQVQDCITQCLLEIAQWHPRNNISLPHVGSPTCLKTCFHDQTGCMVHKCLLQSLVLEDLSNIDYHVNSPALRIFTRDPVCKHVEK